MRRGDTNEGIDFSDIPELGDDFFAHAKKREALVQKSSVIVDRDVYEWFKEHVPASSELISQILRAYIADHQAKSATSGAGQGVA